VCEEEEEEGKKGKATLPIVRLSFSHDMPRSYFSDE
jgi:hypothetical protein